MSRPVCSNGGLNPVDLWGQVQRWLGYGMAPIEVAEFLCDPPPAIIDGELHGAQLVIYPVSGGEAIVQNGVIYVPDHVIEECLERLDRGER
jgi:hypothetical protein